MTVVSGAADAVSAEQQSEAGLDGVGSKSEQVYRWLREQIAAGRLQPKDRVNADGFSRGLAVSKIPVREAIARLVADGALQVLPNAGAVVTPLSWRELAEIQQARLILEPPAAASAASTAPEVDRRDIAELRRNIADMRRWARTGDGDPFELNRRFHLALVAMSGNRVLTDMLDSVLQRVSRYRVLARHTPVSARSTAAEHAGIVEALLARDAFEVQRRLADHLRSSHSVAADARTVDPHFFADSPDAAVDVRPLPD